MIITSVGGDFFSCKDEGNKNCGNYYEYSETNLYVFGVSVISDIVLPPFHFLS